MEPMIRTSIFAATMLALGASAAGAQVFHESNAPIHVPADAPAREIAIGGVHLVVHPSYAAFQVCEPNVGGSDRT